MEQEHSDNPQVNKSKKPLTPFSWNAKGQRNVVDHSWVGAGAKKVHLLLKT